MFDDGVGMQVDLAEPRHDEVEQVRPIEPDDLGLELELVEHVPRARRERGDVAAQVVGDVARVIEELGEGRASRC